MNTAQTINAMGFDIAILTAAAAAPVTFNVDLMFDKFGDPVAGLIIVGKNSQEYQGENHAIRTEGHKRSANRKSAIDATTDDGAEMLVELIDSNQKRLALAVVVGWYGFTNAGEPVPFDKALVSAAFDKYPTWLEKVSAALENDGNFLKV